MNAYTAYMAEQIAQEIKSIEDPLILSIYLRAILFQRCRIGGAKEGTCKGCIYQCHNCRQLKEVNDYELKIFDDFENNSAK